MFSELVVAYLFLGGVGGGGCAVVAIAGLLVERFVRRQGGSLLSRKGAGLACGRLFGTALVWSCAALALGAACLLADIGRVDRLVLLASSAQASYLVIGAWALVCCFVIALAVACMWRGFIAVRPLVFQLAQAVLAVVALVVVTYTGLLLAGMPAVPLWYGPWLPIVFVCSGLSCGMALLVLVVVLAGSTAATRPIMHALALMDMLIIAVEVVAVAVWLASVWFAAGAGSPITPTDEVALLSLATLCVGPQAPGLWLGLGIVGLAAPWLLEAFSVLRYARSCQSVRASSNVREASSSLSVQARMFAAALCVLAGAAVLRYLVVAAALQPMAVVIG